MDRPARVVRHWGDPVLLNAQYRYAELGPGFGATPKGPSPASNPGWGCSRVGSHRTFRAPGGGARCAPPARPHRRRAGPTTRPSAMCSIRGDRSYPFEVCGFAAAAAPAAMGAVRSGHAAPPAPTAALGPKANVADRPAHRPARTRHARACLDPREGPPCLSDARADIARTDTATEYLPTRRRRHRHGAYHSGTVVLGSGLLIVICREICRKPNPHQMDETAQSHLQ